jgi:hypothetical protein
MYASDETKNDLIIARCLRASLSSFPELSGLSPLADVSDGVSVPLLAINYSKVVRHDCVNQ